MCECILKWRIVTFHFPVTVTLTSGSLDGRVSCGKCVLGEYVFRYHKSVTIKVSWAGQDLACSPETVEGILFIETILPLHWRSAI